MAATFDPDRSYPIDITGHGLRAIRHVDAVAAFDARMTRFRGIKYRGRVVDPWHEPGWIGSRGDITRTLVAVVEERQPDSVEFVWDTDVRAVDVTTGEVAGRRFDLVIGADGAGSVVRAAMQEQLEGMAVTSSAISNHGLILELDQVGDRLDPQYLQALALNPFTMSGVVADDSQPAGLRWLAVIGTKGPLTFESPAEAAAWLRKRIPAADGLASARAITAMARRKAVPLGRRTTCSRLHGGRAVLIGDAGVTFPPIGQGCNASLESAMVLDECMGNGPLATLGVRYNATWKPQADALAAMGWQLRYQDPMTAVRALVASVFRINIAADTKSSTRSYADVWQSARKLRGLWA